MFDDDDDDDPLDRIYGSCLDIERCLTMMTTMTYWIEDTDRVYWGKTIV